LPGCRPHVSAIAYEDNRPVVTIRFKDIKGVDLEAYVDSGATFSLIPKSLAEELRLEYVGEVSVITGKGKSVLELYRVMINFLGRDFEIIVAGQDLPEQSPMKALLGRDIMDRFRICFDGRRKVLEFME